MEQFRSERKAKEYLIGKLVEEAEREGKPLSEIERKMLYFTETGWTLPDMMEVNAEFERDYDNDDYERKIAGLARSIELQLETADVEEREAWPAAIQKLSEGDHYLLVLVDPTFEPVKPKSPRPQGDIFKLWLTGTVIAIGLFAGFVLYEQFFGSR